MEIIRNNFIPVKGFKVINLFGILFVRGNAVISEKTLRHEHIHTMQMREMLYVPFYMWYGIEYVIRFFAWSFEIEAYANEHDIDYPKTRKHFS